MRYRIPQILSLLVCAVACTPAARSTSDAAGGAPLAAHAPMPSAAGVTAFVDVAVVPMDTERVLPNHTVLVEGGRITALGPSGKVPVPAGAVRIDGRGKYLIPGLGDMHTHLVSEEADSTRFEPSLVLLVANGVTTIRNLDYYDDGGLLLQMRKRVVQGKILGPRIYTAGPLLGLNSQKLSEIAAKVNAYKAAGYDFIKYRYNFSPDESQVALDSLVAAARRVGMAVAGHAPNQNRYEAPLRSGFTSIEHLSAYQKVGDDMLEDTTRYAAMAGATARAGMWNCPTQAWLEVSMPTVSRSPEARYLSAQTRERLFSGFNMIQRPPRPRQRQMIKALQDSGAGLLLGTDFPMPGMIPGFSVHLELEALVVAGLTPYQALVTGTRNVAKYFGTLDSTGTVAVGKRADLVLLNGNPLADIRQTAGPAGVMLGGRWLGRAELDQRLAEVVGRL